MQRMIFLVLMAAGIIFANGVFAGGAMGNGSVTKVEKPLPSFEGLRIGAGPNVFFHQSQEYRASVEIDSNLHEYLDISVRNGALVIDTKRGRSIRPTRFTVDVYCPSLNRVAISGSADFEAVDKINADGFELSVSGSGTMQGDVECGDYSVVISGSGGIAGSVECSEYSARISGSGGIRGNVVSENFFVNISGSGDILVSGSAKNAGFEISGSGTVDSGELQCLNAEVQVSGSGKVRLGVSEQLRARVSGSGDVLYRGNPKIDYSGSGSGTIRSE